MTTVKVVDASALAVDHDGVLELAVATGLTAYDASYLRLARHLDADLISLDKRLLKAATYIP